MSGSGPKRLAKIVGGLLAVAMLWNAPLLWSLSKPTILPFVAAVSPRTSAATVVDELADNTFVFPRLGITLPLSNNPQSSPLVLKDWDKLGKQLHKGGALAYSEKSFADTKQAYFLAHSSDYTPHRYAGAFAGLNQAKIGDEFAMRVDEITYRYKVISKRLANPAHAQEFRSAEEITTPQLWLVTCWPILTTKYRLIVVGELITSKEAPKATGQDSVSGGIRKL